MVDPDLVRACETAAAAAKDALDWIAEPKNDPLVGQERAFLERTIRSQAFRARRLARSIERPMCVGVFGPSQAGKSYLVSVLARKGDALFALFDDEARPEVDFIRDINPYGEKEATGLVTRFSIERPTTPKGFPVALRLLTQTDVLKIICNAYFFDADLEAEAALTIVEIDAHVARHEAKLAPGYVDVLREEDIWDVEEYFLRQLRRSEAKIFAPFWERFAKAAPRLALAERAELFSILWGRHKALTDLFLELLEGLRKLDFAEDAFCPLASLVPAATGILNVETLAGLGEAKVDRLDVSASGKVVSLPRPVVTALAAELRMTLKDVPWPFFEHTDLLDFPGYRSRTPRDLTKFLRDARGDALKELCLRGKVDYLFQRYTAEQELTGMLLCLRPSNLDVTTLPAVIEEWIGATHGATPEARRGRPQLLFFVLTMFDQHLAEKAGDEGVDPALRFQSRLEASLLKPFAPTANSWPRRWTPDQPFKNCFWIRNPNYKAEGVIRYEGRQEMALLPQKVARIAELREAHARVPEVMAHFRDPTRAFDEVMRLNDGGVAYLAEALAEVCKAGMKEEQARNRLADLRRRMAEFLAPHFVATDAEKRIAERTAVAERVIDDFEECVSRQAFGAFLRALCLDRGDLADAFYEARLSGALFRPNAAGPAETESVPAARRPGGLLAMIKSNAARPPAGTAPAAPSAARRENRTDGFARAALQLWSQTVHDACDDEGFAVATGVPRRALKEVATELIAAARRKGLEQQIKSAIAGVAHIETAEQAAAKATIVAERYINRFVTSLGAESQAPPIAFDAAGIGEHPANFQQDFVLAWLRSFFDQALANARTSDGLVHDPEQNARLGRILAMIQEGLD